MKTGKTVSASTSKVVHVAPTETVPLTESTRFPVVGIGASAGGLAAFEAFFSGMPADTDPGMAFVLVQHLAPDHKSLLAELIRRYTRMTVYEVENGMVVRPNCAYIIPPNSDMAFFNGALQLMAPAAPRGQRLPIDFFFRSLAQDQHERSIGIVLSGTGSDGTLGIRAIKAEGGMAMVQTPSTTEYNGMPRNALATGLVDYVLPPTEMAEQLIGYASHAYYRPDMTDTLPEPKDDDALKRIFVLLRNQAGHDFSQYKPSTIRRRIERRMAVHQIETMDDYVKYAQQTPVEMDALFRDLLIGVTQFFRDAEAFKILEQQVIPSLFSGKSAGCAIRVWSTGCSTGEEAYSIAILLAEHQATAKQNYRIQVFATDIDREAIIMARAGRYPASIATDLTPERLARFFTLEPGGDAYRIHKNIRDMLVFSEQDVIKDPPFSKMDLISCRNLMIYMNGSLQKRLIPLFHYALNPGGTLFLGTSKTVGEFGSLFVALDRKLKVFRRKDDARCVPRVCADRFATSVKTSDTSLPLIPDPKVPHQKPGLRERTEHALLRHIAPSAALVDGQGDILYLHGRSGMYLETPPGEVGVHNILKMAREGLRRELTIALCTAKTTKETVYHPGLDVKTNGHFTRVNLTVVPQINPEPLATAEEPLYLVILEEAPLSLQTGDQPPALAPETVRCSIDAEASLVALRHELQIRSEYLQSTIEELETSTEELKSSNEEMQSVNEELQSTNEELETSKEELQSLNEELSTVNNELQTKVADLSRSNNDMNNLLSGTGIATIFVDFQLHILRFTPAATEIINLIPGDIGRPVSHIVSNLIGYDHLMKDVQAVLDTLVPKEANVQIAGGKWYTLRIQPYRTIDNVIEGAVITFVDITEMMRIKDALHTANELSRLAVVVRDAHDAITVQDLHGRILAWNPGAVRLYGWSESEALTLNIHDRIPEKLRADALDKLRQLSRSDILEPFRTQRLTKTGLPLDVWMTATTLVNEAGQIYAIATTERSVEPTLREEKEKPHEH